MFRWYCVFVKQLVYGVVPLLVSTMFLPSQLFAAEVVADGLPSYTPTHVITPNNALANNGLYARMKASPGTILIGGSYDSFLEIPFDHTVPANTVAYVRIKADESFLQRLLGGSLGDLLVDALGSVLIGNQEIEIVAKNSSGIEVLKESSQDGFDPALARLVQDDAGNYYLRIRPSQDYSRIRINNKVISTSIGLGTVYDLDVYHAFYYDSSSGCDAVPNFTSFDGSGISLAALKLNDPISNIEMAIDSDLENSHSELSLGLLGVLGASSEQLFYFETPVDPGKEILISLATTGSLVDLGLFNHVELVAYSQGIEVNVVATSSLLDLDLLGLLESGEFFEFPISSSTHVIDQVGVRISSLVGLGVVSDVLKISGVRSTPQPPKFVLEGSEEGYELCEGQTLSISPAVEEGQEYNWYLDWEGEVFLGKSETLDIPANQAPGSYTYYLRSNFTSCTFESLPSVISVLVHERTESEEITVAPSGEVEVDEHGYFIYQEGDPVTLNPGLLNQSAEGNFFWYLDEHQSELITDGLEEEGISYALEEDGSITITGLGYTDPDQPHKFYLNYGEPTRCPAAAPKEVILNSMLRILNMRLSSFLLSSKNEETQVEVKWEFYELDPSCTVWIEKSGADLNWQTVGVGHVENLDYGSFLDTEPWAGYNFYRLKVSDHQGKEVYFSPVKSISSEKKERLQYNVFPTLFDDQLTIQRTFLTDSNSRVELYSERGILLLNRQVQWLSGDKSIHLSDLSHIPSGRYFLILSHGDSPQVIHLLK